MINALAIIGGVGVILIAICVVGWLLLLLAENMQP